MEIELAKPFTSPRELAELMGISKQTFWRLRKEGEWKQGIHWNYIRPDTPRSGVRYNTDLCFHWMATRACPEEHERAREAYQRRLQQPAVVNA
jgi:hypothetical protein